MRTLGLLFALSKMMGENYAELCMNIENLPMREAEKRSYLHTRNSVNNQVYDRRAQVRDIGISRRRM